MGAGATFSVGAASVGWSMMDALFVVLIFSLLSRDKA